MFACVLRRLQRSTATAALVSCALQNCQPSVPLRPSRISRAVRSTAPGQEPSTSGELLESAEWIEAASEAMIEAPAPSLEVLHARHGGAHALLRFRGQASYYADSLTGNPTASGEPYQPRAFTAAHRSLPFGTVVRVVRDDSQQLVFVRINDRGPFVRGRVLDLSRAAAEAIGLIERGAARITAEVVEYGPKAETRKKHRKKRSLDRRSGREG